MKFDSASVVEEWRPVLGYEGFYEVSNLGRIRTLFAASNFHKSGKILKPWITRNGYYQIHLKLPGQKRKAECVHRLVLEAFVSKQPNNCETRHLNGNRRDNVSINLAWGTHKENSDDMLRHGRGQQGEKCVHSKLTNSDVRTIRRLWAEGNSLLEMARWFNVDRSNIWYIVTRKTWKHI